SGCGQYECGVPSGHARIVSMATQLSPSAGPTQAMTLYAVWNTRSILVTWQFCSSKFFWSIQIWSIHIYSPTRDEYVEAKKALRLSHIGNSLPLRKTWPLSLFFPQR